MSKNPNPAGQKPDYSLSSTLTPTSTVLGSGSQLLETLNPVAYTGGYVYNEGKATGTLIETPSNKAMYIAAAAVLVIVLFNLKK